MKKTKYALLHSVLALVLCVSMLVGTTFAWFTDSVSSAKNQIIAGNLDIELAYSEDMESWSSVAGKSDIVDPNALWEPGHTEVVYLKITNEGSLDLKYSFNISFKDTVVGKSVLGNDIYLSQHLKYAVVDVDAKFADRDAAREAVENVAKPLAGYSVTGTMEKGAAAKTVALVIFMPETVGNEANYRGDAIPRIDMGITLIATQLQGELDSFGPDYDAGATWPQMPISWVASAPVTVENGVITEATTIGGSADRFTAQIPTGVQVEDDAQELTLEISTIADSQASVSLQHGQVSLSIDVHMDGVAEENTVAMVINLGQIAPAGLYAGNINLYHVENNQTIPMAQVATLTELDAHNEFYYNAETGDVSVAMASFSEVFAAITVANPWTGDFSTSLAGSGTEADPYLIQSAADLAYFGTLVAGGESFTGQYIELTADINMGGKDVVDANGKLLFYPIGVNVSGSSDEIYPFCGTFNGGGHTISNVYQNTWMLAGHYDAGYYNEAMGLFGLIDGGTVKNIVIDGMVAEGEFTDIGCVTAYARGNCTFDNILICNSSCYSYNCRTAGIVGYDWIGDNGSTLNFTNIEIDPSNTFGALWGSWDVACAGILGYKNDASKVIFNKCDVACVLDVYNDVCGNYQYYQYRYAGMMIGTVGKDGDPTDQVDNGNISFTDCTVYYGDWVNYYYCEFEENSMASYSEDYQFSRVDKSEIVFDAAGNATGCTGHDHTAAEDKQAVLIPFNQLFTGYGWGATAVAEGVNVVKTIYTITYINNSKVLDVEYVTDNSVIVSTKNDGAATLAEQGMGDGYDFNYWMNAGSTQLDSIPAGNTENVVLYPSFKDKYTAMFVDQNGNILHWEIFTKGATSLTKTPDAPPIDGFDFDHWEIQVYNADGTLASSTEFTSATLSEVASDITIYPIYTYNGNLKLTPVDKDGDGDTDYYQVDGIVLEDANTTDPAYTNVVIPDYVNGIPVTTISTNAYSDFSNLTTVTIPATVTTIEENAFADYEENWIGSQKREQITIYYEGTREQWDELRKDVTKFKEGWDNNLGDGSHVFFLDEDGNVTDGYYEYDYGYEYKTIYEDYGYWDKTEDTLRWVWHPHKYGTEDCNNHHVKTSDA